MHENIDELLEEFGYTKRQPRHKPTRGRRSKHNPMDLNGFENSRFRVVGPVEDSSSWWIACLTCGNQKKAKAKQVADDLCLCRECGRIRRHSEAVEAMRELIGKLEAANASDDWESIAKHSWNVHRFARKLSERVGAGRPVKS